METGGMWRLMGVSTNITVPGSLYDDSAGYPKQISMMLVTAQAGTFGLKIRV